MSTNHKKTSGQLEVLEDQANNNFNHDTQHVQQAQALMRDLCITGDAKGQCVLEVNNKKYYIGKFQKGNPYSSVYNLGRKDNLDFNGSNYGSMCLQLLSRCSKVVKFVHSKATINLFECLVLMITTHDIK